MSEITYTVVTGLYDPAGEGQRAMISSILGEEDTAERFALYFHWYNVIHELGHLLLRHPPCAAFPEWEEKRIVNDFAVAFWALYGEPEKLARLSDLVLESHGRFSPPAADGEGPMEYAQRNWGTAALMSFNNYGWFQFSLVRDSLAGQQNLADALSAMGIAARAPGDIRVLRFDMADPSLPLRVLRGARDVLRDWGIELNEIPHILSNDPNRHCLSTVGY